MYGPSLRRVRGAQYGGKMEEREERVHKERISRILVSSVGWRGCVSVVDILVMWVWVCGLV